MARPLGPLALQVLQLLRAGPMTAARLACELELPVRRVVVACYWLRVAGRIQVHSSIAEGGCWRPVAVYSLAPPATLGGQPFPLGFDQGRHDAA